VQGLLAEFVRGHEEDILAHPHYRLHVLPVRGLRALAAPGHRNAELRGFAAAALHNIASRARLGRFVERVVFQDARADARWLRDRFDPFATHFATLTRGNLMQALLASGTLPLLMQPVRDIPGAPPGHYWDGGIIDYNLALPYTRLAGQSGSGIVLYPHFGEHIVPGWLDKSLPWCRAARGPHRGWLDNVLIVAPSRQFLARLPRGKLIDRSDFKHFGLDHDARVRVWQQAMGEGERLRDAFARFVERPDVAQIRPI
jgi:hypothetical protein